MTLFADDTHCARDLNQPADLDFFRKSLLVFFSVYKKTACASTLGNRRLLHAWEALMDRSG